MDPVPSPAQRVSLTNPPRKANTGDLSLQQGGVVHLQREEIKKPQEIVLTVLCIITNFVDIVHLHTLFRNKHSFDYVLGWSPRFKEKV